MNDSGCTEDGDPWFVKKFPPLREVSIDIELSEDSGVSLFRSDLLAMLWALDKTAKT